MVTGTGSEASAANDPAVGMSGLDPLDWDRLRRLGHRMVNDVFAHLESVRSHRVWTPVPDSVRERLLTPLLENGIGEEAAYSEFLRDVMPYGIGNVHPRFWGWVIGSGNPLGALGDLLAAGMNATASGLAGSPPLVEAQVLDWLRELLGYPVGTSGILLSGGSMANIVGLAVGLNERAGFDVAQEGLARAPRAPVLYASSQTHCSVERGVRLLGLGSRGLRKIPVDADFRIDLEALETAIARDRVAGRQPWAIVGNAGTTNTGAFDDLTALADLAARERLWLHVDGAFGAFAALVPELSPLVRGIERADSLAFDVHKWMVAPIEAGGVFVRDADAHRRAFAVAADYLSPMPGGLGQPDIPFSALGPQLTRGFKALKVWLALKAHGVRPYAELVRRNVQQARLLARLIDDTPQLELMAPVPLNVVCFRFHLPGAGDRALDVLNRSLVVRPQEGGVAAPSHTTLHGCFVIRACITNHRTRDEDLELFVREVVRIGTELGGD